ncbi:hypothetical protein [Rhodococcus sp. NPDC058521]|uniref:hypothetical protein n=1 Tax=Rhodococcus sp. NPDC058521 TaxID=3346536 RepID=UPI00364C97F9
MSKAKQVTRGWTDVHTGVALCFVLAAVAGLLGGLESGPIRLVVLGVAVVCVIVGMFFDGITGLVVGLVAATAAVAAKRFFGVWNREQFMLAVAIAVCLLVLGWASGLVGTHIREIGRRATPSDTTVRPVYGSLGLLSEHRARPRLEDEIGRARVHKRELGLLILHIRITDPELDESARQGLRRAVARLVESLLRDTDVPFALSPEEFGAILPETDSVAAWRVVGPLVEAAGRSTFTDREGGTRRAVGECAEVHAGLSFLTADTTDADALIVQARASRGAEVMA